MMNHRRDAVELPATLERLISALERLTGRIPLGHALTLIGAIGVLLTSAMVFTVWRIEAERTRHEFDADAVRLQMLLQDRLMQRVMTLEQAAAWFGANDRGMASASWPAARILRVNGEAASPAALSRLGGYTPADSEALASCLVHVEVGATTLCPPATGAASENRFMARALPASRGWVVALLNDADLLPAALSRGDWLLWARLFGKVPVPLHEGARLPAAPALDEAALTRWHRDVGIMLAGERLTLTLQGHEQARGWWQGLMRYASVWAAAAFGLVCTLTALHVYLMLISTRRRAARMASEMSAELERTQSRNQAVMDTAADAIVMVDGQGLVRWCNQATTSIFGRPPDVLVGQPIDSVLPALSPDGLDDWFANHGFSNRVIGCETTGLRNEGTAFPVAVSASRATLDGERIQTFIVRDTTDAKWAEQELILRDRALASSADGVVIASMTLPNHPVIYVNAAFEKITGYEAHEVLGLNCSLLQRHDRNQPGVEAMREAIREGRPCQVVVRNYRKDGSLFYNELAISPVLNAEGALTHYVGVQSDITDRIAAEQVLQLRTERLNAVFDLSPDGFVVLDKRGEVSIVNPAFERMTGLLAADLVGQSLEALEEQLMARCQWVETDAVVSVEGQGPEGDARQFGPRELLHLHTPCARTLTRRVRHGGQDNETVMYFRDVTHEREVDRMKSEFLSMAAHELRTPMASIFGFTELLLKRQFSDERRNDMLSTIHRQAQVLINLVNELLDLARIESRRGKDFKRERQVLQPLIEATLSGLLVHNDPRKVDYHLPEEAIVVDVDREKLSLALTNVLSNAYKYSPGGGAIELSLLWRSQGLQGVQGEVGIQITDHGLGMTPDQLERVFERFFRADTSGNIPGTGLGMTIVKEIIELHGGQVMLTSEHGAGTTVVLWLPVVSGAPVAQQGESEAAMA